ncbi:tubulin-tyrosine ligase family-domain-containing protein [Syncephalastrum racemosum]|uniref:Tubulin-tyrosine ligase family-domain-containing protein n=1 Tax=Syncephalastrum racemosum TaxID=13706 RepID=A0A1X2HQZ0_SYNRA|nr:tubulin-tyrosine ligase family-domain-containing protein [Syncephalastrum racemosum]
MRALVHLDEPYTRHAVVQALRRSQTDWTIDQDVTEANAESQDLSNVALQWLEYEQINWSYVAAHEQTTLVNAYCIRKGLIRKAQLSYNIAKYLTKNPNSILKKAIPETWQFELDHVDYFDEAMNEVYEVERDLKANEEEGTHHMFIIKPSMANKAAGIHVFDSLSSLYNMFEEDDEDSDSDSDAEDLTQVREWVIQRYIANPLLVNQRKFHVRAYVLAVSNIKVYLYRDMLALFALKPYDTTNLDDSLIHLSNTCIQTDHPDFVEEASVQLFWDLPVDKANLDKAFTKMQQTLRDVFDACTGEMTTFQAIPNAFEIFGVDFLVDDNFDVYFLEANAFPDFKQTGSQLQHIIDELFEATVSVAIEKQEPKENLVPVFEKHLLAL